MKPVLSTLASIAALAALAGCGGGGGGDSSAPPPPASTTGLVPAAPALGAVLYSDAAALRPAANGATWTYAGTKTACSTCAPTSYTTTTTQSAVSTSAGTTTATETDSNSTDSGPESTTLTIVSGGTVSQVPTTLVDYTGKGLPGYLRLTELRSPVQVGDQIVTLDQRYTDTAIDYDRDGKTDTLDVAIYSRVIGQESVTLPGRGAVTAVRLDLWLVERVINSSNGAATTFQSTATAWYAPGLGPIKQIVVNPNDSATDNETIVEQLTATSGF